MTLTLDAGHTSYDMETALVEPHRTGYLLEVEGNCPASSAALETLEWSAAQLRRARHKWTQEHGRWARRLLTLHRGHWTVENRDHSPRDVTLQEDRSRLCTGWRPANNAALNNLALAIVFRRKEFATVPEALAAILQPL